MTVDSFSIQVIVSTASDGGIRSRFAPAKLALSAVFKPGLFVSGVDVRTASGRGFDRGGVGFSGRNCAEGRRIHGKSDRIQEILGIRDQRQGIHGAFCGRTPRGMKRDRHGKVRGRKRCARCGPIFKPALEATRKRARDRVRATPARRETPLSPGAGRISQRRIPRRAGFLRTGRRGGKKIQIAPRRPT